MEFRFEPCLDYQLQAIEAEYSQFRWQQALPADLATVITPVIASRLALAPTESDFDIGTTDFLPNSQMLAKTEHLHNAFS